MSGKGHGWLPARWGWSGLSLGNLHEPQTFPTSSLSYFQNSHHAYCQYFIMKSVYLMIWTCEVTLHSHKGWK
jgi:hypothetical protein